MADVKCSLDPPLGFRVGVGRRFHRAPERWLNRWFNVMRYHRGDYYEAWHLRVAWFYIGRRFARPRPIAWSVTALPCSHATTTKIQMLGPYHDVARMD